MNLKKWIFLTVYSFLSFYVYLEIKNKSLVLAPDMLYLFPMEWREVVLLVYLMIEKLVAAIITVVPATIIIKDRVSLVAGLVALLPFTKAVVGYVSHTLTAIDGQSFMFAFSFIEMLSIPVIYLYVSKFVNYALNLLANGYCSPLKSAAGRLR